MHSREGGFEKMPRYLLIIQNLLVNPYPNDPNSLGKMWRVRNPVINTKILNELWRLHQYYYQVCFMTLDPMRGNKLIIIWHVLYYSFYFMLSLSSSSRKLTITMLYKRWRTVKNLSNIFLNIAGSFLMQHPLNWIDFNIN